MNRKSTNQKSGISRRNLIRVSALALAVLFLTTLWVSDASTTNTGNNANKGQPKGYITAIATEAYIYGYPMLMTAYTRRSAPVPYNTFIHRRILITPADKNVVRPNTDTLYSNAFLDLTAEPIVLHVPDIPIIPDTPERYYIIQIMDAWTNVFANPSTTNTGSAAQDFIIVGPNWRGSLPRPMTVFRSPTNLVWILGRTEVRGESDLPAVHAIQNGYTLTSLSEWQVPSAMVTCPAQGVGSTPPEKVLSLTGVQFLKELSCLMGANPAAPQDRPALKRFETIGFVPGEEFKPPPEIQDAINAAPTLALEQMVAHWHTPLGVSVNGWNLLLRGIGTYGTDYLTRGAVAWSGLGANLPEDAVYPATNLDVTGTPLNGSSSYRIHFDAGQTPPVDGFWSITLYDEDYYLVANSWERYAIHNTDPPQFNDDGSLDIYLQPTEPSDPRQYANWLPTPNTLFNLTIRMYGPQTSVMKGKWVPPPVVPTPPVR